MRGLGQAFIDVADPVAIGIGEDVDELDPVRIVVPRYAPKAQAIDCVVRIERLVCMMSVALQIHL